MSIGWHCDALIFSMKIYIISCISIVIKKGQVRKMNKKLFLLVFCLHGINIFTVPGDLDTTFNATGVVVTNIAATTSTTDTARAVVLDRNNNFIVVGTNGTDFALARYLPTGILDTTFGGLGTGKVTTDMTGTADLAYAVALDSEQNIIVVGCNGTHFAIARYTSDGLADENFNNDGRVITQIGSSTTSIGYGVAIDSSDNIIAVGTDGTNFVVAKYLGTGDNAGTLDATFGVGGIVTSLLAGSSTAYGVAIQTDGKIVVVGTSNNDFAIARYTTSGILDTTFNGSQGYTTTNISGTDVAYAVKIQTDGKIVVAGKSGTNFAIARYTTAGVLDTSTFGSTKGYISTKLPGTSIGYSLAITSSGKIIVGGVSNSNFAVAQYTSAGVLDTTSFGSGVGYVTTDLGSTDVAYGLALTSSGNILLAGTNKTDFALVQYTSTGSLDTVSFGAGTGKVTTDLGSGTVDAGRACAVQADGKIIVVGQSVNDFSVVRYTPTGVLDTTFGTGGKVTTDIGSSTIDGAYGVAVQPDGKIIVVGTSANKFAIVRYTPAGVLDTTFGTGGKTTTSLTGTSIAYDVAIQTDGKIVVAGVSNSKIIVARYTSAGVLDTTTFAATKGYVLTSLTGTSIVYGVALTSSGKIVVAGVSNSQLMVAQYTSAGVLDTTAFGSGLGYVATTIGTTSSGYAVAINGSGKIIVSGVTTTSSNSNFVVAQYTSAGVLDTTFGSGNGYVITEFGSTDIGCNIAVQPNGNIIVGGISGGNCALSRYTSTGVLDSTFGVNGKITTELDSGKVSGFMGLSLQQDGKIVVSATTSSMGGDFVTARYLGDGNYQGCLDTIYKSNGYFAYPVASSAGYNPRVTALQIQSDNSVYVVSQDLVTTVQSRLVKLNSDGSTALSSIIIPQAGATDVIQDINNNILVVGTDTTSHGWVRRYTTTGSFLADTTFGSSGCVNETINSTSFKRICLQASDRIIVMGQGVTSTTGILIGYKINGTIDTIFGTSSTGVYAIASRTFCDMVIGSDDTIYVVYQGSTNIEIAAIKFDGSGLVSTYNSGGAVSTGLVSTSYGAPSISFDNNGKIIIAVVATSTGSIVVQRYTTAGVLDVLVIIPTTTSLLSSPVIKQLQCDTNNRPIFVGYDINNFFVGRVQNNITSGLDTTFASFSAAPGIANSIYNSINPTDSTLPKRVMSAVGISTNGSIVCGGYEAITSRTSTSLLTRITGDTTPYGQVDRYPQGKIGTLDQTFNSTGLNPGSINLHAELQLNYGQAKQIEFSALNDIYYIALDNGLDTQIVSMNSATDTKNTVFGSSGVLTISGKKDVADLFLDATGTLNVVGGSGASGSCAGWMQRYNASTGSLISSFVPTDCLDIHTDVKQQTSTRILVTGQDDGVGTIIAYNSITGAVDTTFAVTGKYTTGYNSVIDSMIIGLDDAIYFVTNNGTNATTKKISSAGRKTLWTGDSVIAHSGVSTNNHLSIDTNGNPVVCTVDTRNQQIVLKKYNKNSGATCATLNLTNVITGFSAPVIKSLIIDSNNKIIITGYDNVTNNITFVMRVTSDLSCLDSLFNTAGAKPGIQSYLVPVTAATRTWNDIHINAQGDIFAVGSVTISENDTPYITRFYGDSLATQNKIVLSIGSQGSFNTNFGTNGIVDLETLHNLLKDIPATVILSDSNGNSYIAFDGETSSSLIRITNSITLDTTYNSTGSVPGIGVSAPGGVHDIIMDGNGCILLIGTSKSYGGWIQRYTTDGLLDNTFGVHGVISGEMSTCQAIIQQTLGRYVVAGSRDGYGVLRAYTISGKLDITFNNTGLIPGEYNTGVTGGIYNLIADQYDRLVFAQTNEFRVDLTRLNSHGYLDESFNYGNGYIPNIISRYVDTISQVRVVFDIENNIVVAAHINDGTEKIAIVGYDTTGTIEIYPQSNITNLVDPVLTDIVAKEDGKLIVGGYQSGNNPMWVARMNNGGSLDTTFGNNSSGVLTFVISSSTKISRILQGLSVQNDGQLSVVGYETDGIITDAYLVRLYLDPYQTALKKYEGASLIGTLDGTLGKVGSSLVAKKNYYAENTKKIIDDTKKREGFRSTTEVGVTFFASPGADATYGQVAQAVALQDVNTVVVAIDGAATSGGSSCIFINEFDVNGAPVTAFNGTGQATVPQYYQNEYVRDMVTFTTTAAVHKAILVGYATNTTLGITNSVVWQYNLSAVGLDITFGGFNGNPAGIAFGIGKQAHVVGTQSNGRIIVGGLDQAGNGLIVGYSSHGKLDSSFGSNGSGLFKQGTTGIYTHAIDTENRILIAYNDGSNNVAVARFLSDGSGLDTSFNTTGTTPGIINTADRISGISGNTNMKIAIDTNNQVVGSTFVVTRYYQNGTLASGTSIQETVVIAATSLGGTSSSLYTIAKLLIDTENKTIITAYDAHPTPNDIIVMRLTANLSGLDTTLFNASQGYISYQVSTGNTQVGTDALIHPDGRIIVVGSES